MSATANHAPTRKAAAEPDETPQRQLSALAGIVDAHIRREIAHKTLRPGTLIDFNALARELNMSRTPIRESIRNLHNAGLLESINGGQFRVTVLSQEKIAAFYTVRIALEGSAAQMAAASITSLEIDLLGKNLEMFADPATPRPHLPTVDQQFHEIIYEATRNRYLANRLKSLRAVLGLIPRRSFDDDERIRRIHAEHTDIWRAIERRDPQGAREAALAHIRAAMQEPLSPIDD